MENLFKYISNMLFWIGFFMLFITFYSIYIDSPYQSSFAELNLLLFLPMLANILFILKTKLIRFLKKNNEMEEEKLYLPKIGHIESFIAFMWLVSPFLFAYIYYSYSFDLVDALFESFSAITTTGLSVYNYNLPPDILLFRSFITWVGGIGFVGFSLTTLRGVIGRNLARAFGLDEIHQNIGVRLFLSYSLITLIGIIACLYVGFNLFNSINLALAAIGNGGFIPYNVEWNTTQKYAINFIQLLGAISFPIYAVLIFERDIKKAFRSDLKAFILAIIVLSLIFIFRGFSVEKSLSLVIPAISTGGFQEESLNLDDFGLYLIIISMLIGGMQLSSAGGLKISKIYIAIKGLLYFISKKFRHDRVVQSLYINGKPITFEDLFFVYAFITSFILLYIISVLVLLYGGLSMNESLFTAASAISNTGYSIVDIASLSDEIKLFLIFIMYLGRIEILQFFILIYSFYDRLRT